MLDNLAYQEGWMDPLREERIGGKAVMMAPASTNHTFTAGNIFHIFKNYLRGKSCVPISDGVTVYLTEEDHFVPDMMVVCDRSKIQYDGIHGAPDLVVEVMSPSTMRNDKTHKKDVYAKCGVREYWLVNPADRSIEVYHTDGAGLVLHDIYAVQPAWTLRRFPDGKQETAADHFPCSLFEDLEISLEEIFSGLLP